MQLHTHDDSPYSNQARQEALIHCILHTIPITIKELHKESLLNKILLSFKMTHNDLKFKTTMQFVNEVW